VLIFEVSGTVVEWRGPAPFYFLPTDEKTSQEISELRSELSYGWGVIPAQVTIGSVTVRTSLIPKAGSFYIPLKNDIRIPNKISAGDEVNLTLEL